MIPMKLENGFMSNPVQFLGMRQFFKALTDFLTTKGFSAKEQLGENNLILAFEELQRKKNQNKPFQAEAQKIVRIITNRINSQPSGASSSSSSGSTTSSTGASSGSLLHQQDGKIQVGDIP